MISALHLDYHHDLAQLAIDGYVAEPGDVIAEERDGLGAERELGERLIHFNCTENRHTAANCSGSEIPGALPRALSWHHAIQETLKYFCKGEHNCTVPPRRCNHMLKFGWKCAAGENAMNAYSNE
jgi:hypothetical protein